ncbi:MAG: hypothetical protein JSS65_11850 [Armatimonadetes bacterium]|nr:hypothetical protein [Armatimonadota bacterium]
MKVRIIALCGILTAISLFGCNPDKSGDTQTMKEKSPPPAQMPRSKEEAQKMFGGGGGSNPVAPPSNK